MQYAEAALPFEFGEGPKYVVAIHGFTGLPYEMMDLGKHLASNGFHVIVPRLPGHGRDKKELLQTRWPDWWGIINKTIEDIKNKKPSHIFVTGLSMGGSLTLYAASQYPEIKAIAPICAPVFLKLKILWLLPFIKYFVKYFSHVEPVDIHDPAIQSDPVIQENIKRYDKSVVPAVASLLKLLSKIKNKHLSKIKQPVLISQATKDIIVHPTNASYIFDHIGSTDKSLLWLENSGHVATMDYDREKLYKEITEFFMKYI